MRRWARHYATEAQNYKFRKAVFKTASSGGRVPQTMSHSPRVTRRHFDPTEPNPAGRLHGMSANEADAAARQRTYHTNSHHLSHTAQEKVTALIAGTRLQPKSNPHITKLLKDYLQSPIPTKYQRLVSELVRGPVFVFVSETEMALKESEIQLAAMRYNTSGVDLPTSITFSPLLFTERDSDKKEDGDSLMVKRQLGTLAPEYSYKRGSAFISLYTDSGLLQEATKHPYLQSTGIDRVTYIGISVASVMSWVKAEMEHGEMSVYLNKWTESEAMLHADDISDIAAYVEKYQTTTHLAEFTPLLEESSDHTSETWNTYQDKRETYIEMRRQHLRERRSRALDASEKEFDMLAAGAANDVEADRTPLPLLGSWSQACPDNVRNVIVAILLQRPEVKRAAALTGANASDVLLYVDSSDLNITAAKLRTVFRYFERASIAFPSVRIEQYQEGLGCEIYSKPSDLLRMGA